MNWFALITAMIGIWWGFTVATKPAEIARSWGFARLVSSGGAMVVARILGVWLVVLGAFMLFRAFNPD